MTNREPWRVSTKNGLDSKEGRDVVTATDLACEDAIRSELSSTFPAYPIVGEERGGKASREVPYWLVDPICGTRSYASGLPLYCTNIALVEDGVVTVAAIGVGRSDEVMYAERGSGARMQTADGDQKIAANDDSETIWISGRTDQNADVVQRVLQLNRWYVWLFSSSVFYAYLAAGRISGILHFGLPTQEAPVHTAAGCLVAGESGAIVSDLENGDLWNLSTRSFLAAATPSLHRELFKLVEGDFAQS